MSTLKFGLNIQRKAQNAPSHPAPAKRKLIFNDEEPEPENKPKDTEEAEEIGVFDFDSNVKSSGSPKPTKLTKPKGSSTVPPNLKKDAKKKDPSLEYEDLSSLQTCRKHAEEALAVDSSIYDYDAAYDALHAKSAARLAAEREEVQQRKPKYMNNLFESAEVRKRDQLRAKDKVLQREREAEGDEFADKEKFVTGAYKQQQEEVRRLEEEEKKRQEEEDRKKRGRGMQGFYRKIMDMDEKKHREAMEAAAEARKPGEQPVEEAPKEKSEVELARELNAKGGNIIINEEGQVADKRQLLSAGLNVVAKPKPIAMAATTSTTPSGPQNTYRGRDATQKAVRERQSRMMEEQLEQAAKRAADEEAEERGKLEHASKSRKTEGDISSAKERYLQRKREAAAAAAAKGP
jgi:coiled-coil domain-containing protein 55